MNEWMHEWNEGHWEHQGTRAKTKQILEGRVHLLHLLIYWGFTDSLMFARLSLQLFLIYGGLWLWYFPSVWLLKSAPCWQTRIKCIISGQNHFLIRCLGFARPLYLQWFLKCVPQRVSGPLRTKLEIIIHLKSKLILWTESSYFLLILSQNHIIITSESWTTLFQQSTHNHAVIITPHKEKKTEIFVLIAGNSMPRYAAEWSWNTQQVSSRAQNRICQSRLYMLYLSITSFIL